MARSSGRAGVAEPCSASRQQLKEERLRELDYHMQRRQKRANVHITARELPGAKRRLVCRFRPHRVCNLVFRGAYVRCGTPLSVIRDRQSSSGSPNPPEGHIRMYHQFEIMRFIHHTFGITRKTTKPPSAALPVQ